MNSNVQLIRTSVIKVLCNPFDGCWRDIPNLITLEEITQCLDKGEEEFIEMGDFCPWVAPSLVFKEQHIKKISYFVKYGFNDPIHIDVGIPVLNYYRNYLVTDGNHRLASAIYKLDILKEDTLVPCSITGQISYAQELGLNIIT